MLKNAYFKALFKLKRKYLWHKLVNRNATAYDKSVFRYLLIDVLKYYFSYAYIFLIKFAETKFSELYKQYKAFFYNAKIKI